MTLLSSTYSAYGWFMVRLRTMLWRQVLGAFGEGSAVLGRVVIGGPNFVRIGRHTTLNEGVMIDARVPVMIGDWVSISPGAMIFTGGLNYNNLPRERRGHIHHPVTIGSGAWICAGAIITGGVTVGEDSIVAAGAVVVEDVPPHTLVGGVPAKVIKPLVIPAP